MSMIVRVDHSTQLLIRISGKVEFTIELLKEQGSHALATVTLPDVNVCSKAQSIGSLSEGRKLNELEDRVKSPSRSWSV